MKLRSFIILLASVTLFNTAHSAYAANWFKMMLSLCGGAAKHSKTELFVAKVVDESLRDNKRSLSKSEADRFVTFIADVNARKVDDIELIKNAWLLIRRYEYKTKSNISVDLAVPFLRRGLELCRDNHTDIGGTFGNQLGHLYGNIIREVYGSHYALEATRALITEISHGDIHGPNEVFSAFFSGNYAVAFKQYLEEFDGKLTDVETEALTLLYLRSRLAKIAFTDSYMENGGGSQPIAEIRAIVADSRQVLSILRERTELHTITAAKLDKYDEHLGMLVYDGGGRRGFGQVRPEEIYPQEPGTSADHWKKWREQDFLLNYPYTDIVQAFFPISFQPPAMRARYN